MNAAESRATDGKGTEAPTLLQVVNQVVADLLRHGFGKRTIEITAQDGRLLNAKVLHEDSYRIRN